MKPSLFVGIALAVLAQGPGVHAREATATSAPETPPPSIESARVEEVLQADDHGYRSVAYVVTRNGVRVAVTDPLGQTSFNPGDKIKFTVAYWQPKSGDGLRTMNFILLPPIHQHPNK